MKVKGKKQKAKIQKQKADKSFLLSACGLFASIICSIT
ncbi:hypothetical protein HMPREF1564_0497 [Providencia alcalifaciens R90-1475]|nr:hypothetical protein HMPREF1564_0497 [Providencia alcalifaciens R90-1475]